MPILTGLGWRKFFSIDLAIPEVTNLLRAQLENTVLECERSAALGDDLYLRCINALRGASSGTNGGLGALPGASNQGRPVAPFVYEEEPQDEWRTFGVMAEGRVGQSIYADCDCLAPAWGGFLWRRWKGSVPVGVGISQPKTRPCRCRAEKGKCSGVTCTDHGPVCDTCGYGMAHAYTVVREKEVPRDATLLSGLLVPMSGQYSGIAVLDGSVLGGMQKPRASFYGAGETSLKWLRGDEMS